MVARTARSLELEGEGKELPATGTKTVRLYSDHTNTSSGHVKDKREKAQSVTTMTTAQFILEKLLLRRKREGTFLQRLHFLILQLVASHSESSAT